MAIYTPSTDLIGLYTLVDGMPATRRKYERREEAASERARKRKVGGEEEGEAGESENRDTAVSLLKRVVY